jgi:hypothetical protein
MVGAGYIMEKWIINGLLIIGVVRIDVDVCFVLGGN